MQQNWRRPFITIYVGQAFSILGSAAVQFAIIWWLTIQTESALTLTVATIVGFLPTLFLGPFAGVLADRFNRRTVMIAADGLVAFASVLLGAMFLYNPNPPLWFIYGILFLRGLGSTFHTPAMQAAVPMLVPPEMLTKAGGWGNLIHSLSNMLGPVLGALLMGFLPLAAIMLVDIAGALFAIICLLFVKIPNVQRTAEMPHVLADITQGFAAMRANKPLMAVFFPMVLCNLLYTPMGSLLPLLVRTHFNGTAWHNSVVEFLFAGGLLVSSLIIGVWGGARRRFTVASLSIITLGVFAAATGLLPSSWFVVFAILCAFLGACATFINVPLTAYMQETIAPEMMGKVFALLMASMTLAMPFGLLIAGPASEILGVDRWFFFSGLGIIVSGVLCLFLSRRYDTVATPKTPAQETQTPVSSPEK